MSSWTTSIIDEVKTNLNVLLCESLHLDNYQDNKENKNMPLHYPFRLPIEYLPQTDIHPLSTVVTEDLELVETKGELSVYEKLFQPTNTYGMNMIQEWKKNFTSNKQYLLDTQQVIQETEVNEKNKIEDDRINIIWKELKKNDDHFLEKYCYIEWDFLKILNRSSSFLQIMTIINMMSPVLSLLLPLMFLIIPFIILKLRNIPIKVSVYLSVLKDIAKHHFIGRSMSNLSSMNLQNLIYFLGGLFMFCYQIYQNVVSCQRFYHNVQKLSKNINCMKKYLQTTMANMRSFNKKHKTKKTYKEFCKMNNHHVMTLQEIYDLLESQDYSEFSMFDVTRVGFLLKVYYELHANTKYEESLRYSFGFEGFLDNLRGVKYHMVDGHITNAKLTDKSCFFEEQYYPLHMNNEDCVKNNCNLKKKTIITGPNASGKTTLLKTTTINIIFSQQVGVGFFKRAHINPYTHIHSYLNIPDTSERDSLFQAESRRCKEIIDNITTTDPDNTRHYGIFDELYSGTNPDEATKTGYAFLKYLSKYKNVDFILTTHYNKICTKLKKNEHIQNYQMKVNQTGDGKLEYTYKVKKGISKVQGALCILEDMEYPKEIIDDVKMFSLPNIEKKIYKESI